MTKNLVEDKKEISQFFNYFFETIAGGTEGRSFSVPDLDNSDN